MALKNMVLKMQSPVPPQGGYNFISQELDGFDRHLIRQKH